MKVTATDLSGGAADGSMELKYPLESFDRIQRGNVGILPVPSLPGSVVKGVDSKQPVAVAVVGESIPSYQQVSMRVSGSIASQHSNEISRGKELI